jgi:hypothetical protein
MTACYPFARQALFSKSLAHSLRRFVPAQRSPPTVHATICAKKCTGASPREWLATTVFAVVREKENRNILPCRLQENDIRDDRNQTDGLEV